MAHITSDRVSDTATTTGTGSFTVSGAAPSGYQTFGAVMADGDTCYYAIQHASLPQWEVGLATYSATNQIARTTVYASSNAGALVNFSSGDKSVFLTLAAARTVQLDASGAPLNLGTLPVASGGTGAATTGDARASLGLAIGSDVQGFSANLAAFAGKTAPTGAVVGATDAQTLTNKTVQKLVLNDGYTEDVFAVTDGTTVNLDPNNGSIQTWTLGANRTPGQVNWAAGQSITLMVDDGTARTITWTTLAVVWETNGGVAPTLAITGFTVIVLWKVGTTIYGARVGDA